ncbi:hypothetical protein ACHAXS_004236 [Conticribra weissflogii]
MSNPRNNSPDTNEDFYHRVLSSFNRHTNLTSMSYDNTEAFAKSLIENDAPKIDAAVKSYLSLVAARSAVASTTDVRGAYDTTHLSDVSIPFEAQASAMTTVGGRKNENHTALTATIPCSNDKPSNRPGRNATVKCTFATKSIGVTSPMDANRYALICARTLLTAINSTKIPSWASQEKKGNSDDDTANQFKTEVIRVLWNRLIGKCSDSNLSQSIDNKISKPSKLFGKKSLLIVYPYVMERFRRGLKKDETNNLPASFSDPSNNSLQSIFDEELPPVPPPTGIDMGQWEAFYVEFGELLSKACYLQPCVNEEKEDDSALLWSTDRGAGELLQRRERRSQCATDALAVAHAGYEVLDKKVDETFRTHGDANNAGKDTENNSMK